MPPSAACWAVLAACALTHAMHAAAAALSSMPVRLNIARYPGPAPGANTSVSSIPARTRPELFQRVLQSDVLRNSTDGWYALQSSGLFWNLSASVVQFADNQSRLEIGGVELPAARLSPDVAIALSRRTGWPELSGGLRYENRNFRGLGEKLLCEVSQRSGDVLSAGGPLPSYNLFWSDCNFGDSHVDIAGLVTADTVPLSAPDVKSARAAAGKTRISKIGMKFDRRFTVAAAQVMSALSCEPYSVRANPLAGETSQESGFNLLGGKLSLSMKSFRGIPFMSRIAVDTGFRTMGSSVSPFTSWSVSAKTLLPDIALNIRSGGSFARRLLRWGKKALGNVPPPLDTTGVDSEADEDEGAHITSFVTMSSAWCHGSGCVPSMHYSSSQVRDSGPELYSTHFTPEGIATVPERPAVKAFHGVKIDSYFSSPKLRHAAPGIYAEGGIHTSEGIFKARNSPLKPVSEVGLSLRIRSVKIQLGLPGLLENDRLARLSVFLDSALGGV